MMSPEDRVKRKKVDADYYQRNKEKIIAEKKIYNRENKVRISEYQRIYYKKNKEHLLKQGREYADKNRDHLAGKRAEWSINNKDSRRIYKKIYNKINRDKINEYNRKYKVKNRERVREYNKKYRKNPRSKFRFAVRRRIRAYLSAKGFRKTMSFSKILGCTYGFLWAHLESQFRPGMTRENHGPVWHIDHIIPLSSAETQEDAIKLCHYTNLQPLFAEENLRKGKKLNFDISKFNTNIAKTICNEAEKHPPSTTGVVA